MNQRKCGTCRYFEEGGIASSGWCRHPERQELEHMVLVRKTELACRNGWDDDLWEPREGKQQSASNGMSRMSRPAAGTRRSASDAGADTVLEQAEPAGSRAQAGNDFPAQVTVRDRSVTPPREAQELDTRGAWSSSFPVESSSEEAIDKLQAESVVSRTGSRVGNRPDQFSEATNHKATSIESIPAPPAIQEKQQDAQRSVEPYVNGRSESQAIPADRRESRPVQQSGLTDQFDVEPEPAALQAGSEVQNTEAEPAPYEAENDSASDEGNESLRLPMLADANACCRNCRDFLPSKEGGHGWCNNPFAFEQRKEVNGDTVACQSTFGNWWSPSDDWWMERADIAHHSAPTPLVDNLIRQIRTRLVDDEGSTEVRERS